MADSLAAGLVEHDVEQLCYRLGLRDVQLVERPGFCEVKVSPRSPSLVKAYIFRRFGLISVSSDCMASLGDREGVLGFFYLPVSDAPFARVSSSAHRRDELWFYGKPIQSNLEAVLSVEQMKSEISSSAIPLCDDDLFRRDEGIILCFDVGRYGYGQARAASSGSLLGDGEEVSLEFSRRMLEAMVPLVSELGTVQIHHAGDGFLAAIPERHGYEVVTKLKAVLTSWRTVCDQISRLAASVSSDLRLTSRLAIIWGKYRFGRIGGLSSPSPGFEGPDVVAACRIEAALSAWASNRNKATESHLLAIGSALMDLVGSLPEWLSLAETNTTLQHKEYSGSCSIFTYQGEKLS